MTRVILFYLLISISVLKAEDEEYKPSLAVVSNAINNTPIALSVTKFTDLLQYGNVFVDHSLLIKEIIESDTNITILEAPKGWGKSTNLKLLKMFFELEMDEMGEPLAYDKQRNPSLFEKGEYQLDNGVVLKLKDPLLIRKHKELYSKNLGLYPIVYLNFTGFRPDTYEDFLGGIEERIFRVIGTHNETIQKFLANLESHLNIEKSKVEPIQNMFKAMEHLERSVMCLCYVLEKHYHTKPIILWENFDEPLAHILIDPQFTQTHVAVNFFVDLFDYSLQANKHLHKAIISGTSKLLIDYAQIIPSHHLFHGFTDKDLDLIFDHFGIDPATRRLVITRYGNYKVDEYGALKQISDPSCVVKFLQSRKLEPYWTPDTTVTRLLAILLSHPPIEHSFRKLLSGHSYFMFPRPDVLLFPHTRPFHRVIDLVKSMVTKDGRARGVTLSYSDQKNAEDTVMRIFYANGFLTLGASWQEDKIETVIPNEEVAKVVKKEFLQHYGWRLGVPDELKSTAQSLSSQFIKFLFMVDETSPELGAAFEKFIRGLPCYPITFEIYRNRPNKDAVHDILEFITFYMGCFTPVNTHNETSWVIEGTTKVVAYTVQAFRDHGVVIVMTMGDTSPQFALNEASNHLHFLTIETRLIRSIQTVRKVGINYTANQTVQIAAETIEFRHETVDVAPNPATT